MLLVVEVLHSTTEDLSKSKANHITFWNQCWGGLLATGKIPVANHYLMKDLFLFYVALLIPSLPHIHFFLFSDTCSLGSKGFIKF
jgi:hypothetical protein